MQGLAASGGTASVLRNATAAAACGAVALTASGSVENTMPLGQAATAKAAEPAAEAAEEADKSSASVGAAQDSVASAAGAEAVQEAVESPAGSARAASGAGPFRQTADSVIEASMSSATERVASGGNSLHPPQPASSAGAAINFAAETSSEAEQQQALVQAFTQGFVQHAMVAGALLTSTAPEHVTAAVLSALNKALSIDGLQRGSAASEHHLAAIEASVACAESVTCPAADLKGTAGSAADLRGTAGSAADLRGTACTAADLGGTACTAADLRGTAGSAAQLPYFNGTAALAAPAAATPSSALESGSTAARLTSADETAAASTGDAAVDVSQPSADEKGAASTVDAAVHVSEPSAADAAQLDALHYAGAGPAKLQLMGQDDVPRLVGSGAFPTWHGCVLIVIYTLCKMCRELCLWAVPWHFLVSKRRFCMTSQRLFVKHIFATVKMTGV